MTVQIEAARYSAMDFARYIINFCTINGIAISDLKLQKVLYYIQLAFILHLHRDAFTDEIEAWPYGPVIRDVYNAYSSYGSTKICLEYHDTEIFEEKEKEIIQSVLTNCLKRTAWELVAMSHTDDGPWANIYKNGLGYKEIIPIEMIREYALG